MKFTVEWEEKSAERLRNDINKLFTNIELEVTRLRNYDKPVQSAKDGLVENANGFENSPKYAALKSDLKQKGLIPYATPGLVTGQLMEDLQVEIMSKSPNEIIVAVAFDDVVRDRPTLKSMWEVSRGIRSAFVYSPMSSDKLAGILQESKFNFLDSIYDLYHKDFVKATLDAIDKAFKNV